MLETRDLRLVQAVNEEGSLTRAALRLHLTQSALSHRLKDLEAQLGCPLFQRTARRMVATEAGRRLAETAVRCLEDLSETERFLRKNDTETARELRISAECYTCYHWLPGVLKSFHRLHPDTEVRIVLEATRRSVEAIFENKLDLAIISGHSPDERLVHRALFTDELVAIVAPGHPFTKKSYVRAEDFESEHLLMYQMSPSQSEFFQRVMVPANLEPRRVSQVQLTEAILQLAGAGLGVAVMARWAVKPQLERGQVCAVPVTSRGLRRTWYAALDARRVIPPAYSDFADLVRKHLETIGFA